MPATSHPLNPMLAIAIIALPALFVWLLLLPGHARSTRMAGFVFAFWMTVPGVVVAVFG